MLVLRKDIPDEMTWDVASLFETEAAWQSELEVLQNDVAEIIQYEGKLQTSAATLFDALQAYEKFQIRIENVFTYAMLLLSVDGEDERYQANYKNATATIARLEAKLAFFESELLEIPDETLTAFFQEDERLQTYKPWIEKVFQKKPYMLTCETEKVLAAFSDVFRSPYTIYEQSKIADMTFSPIKDVAGNELEMSEALFEDQYEISPNRTIRKRAYESFTDTFSQYEHTYAATYATEINKQVTIANVRGYDSVIDMLLHEQQVTRDMYESQLRIIFDELKAPMRKLATIKKEQFGLENIHFYDVKAPLMTDFEPEVTFDKGKQLILDALAPLGNEYVEVIEQAFSSRWIDYAANKGKQSGAYCASPFGVHPYVFLTWTNEMRNVFTLAHELGHAGHFYLAQKEQNYLHTDVSMYFVEAPSTMNELFLGHHLLETEQDVKMKRWVITQLLDTYYHNFVTHFLEAMLQDRLYTLAEEGMPLTTNVISSTKLAILKEFWGSAVEIDDRARLTWMRQPHYYMGLYPYTYSAGLTIATRMFQQIEEEGTPMIDRWLDVLKTGGKEEPLALCQMLGIDMTDEQTFQSVLSYIGSLVDKLVNTTYK